MKRILFALAALLVLAAGCTQEVDPTSVKLDQHEITLAVGQTVKLNASIAPANATNTALSWSSNAPAVATVKDDGTVTAKDEGQAIVTVATLANGKSDACLVVVKNKTEEKVLVIGDVATVSAEGGTLEVAVRSNVQYSVEIEAAALPWLHYVKTKAVTDGTLVFLVDANNTGGARKGTVKLNVPGGEVPSPSFTVTQLENAVLSVQDNNIEVAQSGGHVTVMVNYNTDYTAEVEESAQSWISILQTKSLSTGTLVLDVQPNEGTERRGRIVITEANGALEPVKVLIIQKGENTLEKARAIMDKVYEAWGAQKWTRPWIPGEAWPGLEYIASMDKVRLFFEGLDIHGPIPDCIGELGDLLYSFGIHSETGITGPLPDSFRNLTALEDIGLVNTSITSLPDVFSDMKELKYVNVYKNEKLTGPIPVSIGSSPELRQLTVFNNAFTGGLDESFARLATSIYDFRLNHLTGKIPDAFLALENQPAVLKKILDQQEGYGFDLADIDLHGYLFWPTDSEGNDRPIKDLDNNVFSVKDVVSKNDYTVFVSWAPWCPFSSVLMPQLRDYYNKYRADGLEVLATVMVTEDWNFWKDNESLKQTIQEKGYGSWYNFPWWDNMGSDFYLTHTPAAEVYDKNGNILFSSMNYCYDPVRNRFGKTASAELIPFLESLFGPSEDPDVYISSDYSKDSEVLTLQTASVGKGINLVFMGDGYTDKDMAEGGLYESLMSQMMEEFFAIEPYKSFRDRFNVFAVKAVSPNGRIGEGYSTALQTQFGYNSEVWGDYDKVENYVLGIPSISSMENVTVAVLVNTRRHAGMTLMSAGNQSGIAFVSSGGNDRTLFGPTLRHETGGHAMAFLADEYYEVADYAPASHIESYNAAFNQYGWFSNVDFTNNPSSIRWHAFLERSEYKDEVGIFEGAALYSKGAYRPSENSMMNMNFEYFNAPSRWAIYKRIMELSGEEYSFEKFLDYDAVNRTSTAKAARRQSKASATQPRFQPTAPPVIVP